MKMPKINIEQACGSDKAGRPQDLPEFRVVEDLLMIQDSKAYVNEKKQLQQLVMHLYSVGYYETIDNEQLWRLYLK